MRLLQLVRWRILSECAELKEYYPHQFADPISSVDLRLQVDASADCTSLYTSALTVRITWPRGCRSVKKADYSLAASSEELKHDSVACIMLYASLHALQMCCAWTKSGPKNVPRLKRQISVALTVPPLSLLVQDAQLSQRDRAAGCVMFSPKVEDWNWETIFYGQYRSIFNHCDIIGRKICQIPWKNAN